MKLFELDSHPIIVAFRQQAKDYQNDDISQFHLLLPPEYNISNEVMDPKLYLFVEKIGRHGYFVRNDQNSYVFRRNGEKLTAESGFSDGISCSILHTTPCSTSAGFSFEMHEIDINPYQPSPIPPLCYEIREVSSRPELAMDFLLKSVRSNQVPRILHDAENFIYVTRVTPESKDQILEYLHKTMDQICDAVFNVTSFKYIPTIFKMQTNYIIFYAVAGLCHSTLLNAFHQSMTAENKIAREAVKKPVKSCGDPKKLDEASLEINGLAQMKTVAEGVAMITRFFDKVMDSIPDQGNATADEILPAICDGISRCSPLATHIASSFQYICDIWPPEGLDERVSYKIVTCTIAASHFSDPRPRQEISEISNPANLEAEPEDSFIDEIEDFLSTL